MIIRIWRGWTSHANADPYQQLLDDEIVPAITARAIDGLHGVDVLRRDIAGDEVEFVTIMTLDGWPAVRAFAGDDPSKSVVPEAARALLRRFDAESQHYELAASHPASRPRR